MRWLLLFILLVPLGRCLADQPNEAKLIVKPDAFQTLINPACSHCRDEAKRRAGELRPDDRVLCWIRGYSEGGAIPMRFFLSPYRVISDSYGVFVYDPDAGYARGFAPSYEFRFHGWRNGVMVMKHKDGTLYSCLSGLAFDGPRKGTRLTPAPTVVSDWGFWLEKYPGAVAYHMYDKYQPKELPTQAEPDSVQSRTKPDTRLKDEDYILGVWTGKVARAYPIARLEKEGMLKDEIEGEEVVVLWEPRTRTAAAFRPVATQPRKFKGPEPGHDGISPPDAGELVPKGTSLQPDRKLTLALAEGSGGGRFVDAETKTVWDVAGRGSSGSLKGWTLAWVDGVQVKWRAWAAEYPETSIYPAGKPAADMKKTVKEIAGTAEFLRVLPKPFATLKDVDPKNRTVTLLIDGQKLSRVWPLDPDAEVKRNTYWGRLEQFQPGERVWVWLRLDRKKNPISVVMLADEVSEEEFHGSLKKKADGQPKFTTAQLVIRREAQHAWLRQRWLDEGLPGTVTFHHVFSGELEIALDHEAMRWGRSLVAGDVVHLTATPPIKGVVRAVTPWRERTVVRLVVGELESSELKIGQRLGLKMSPPSTELESSPYPPDSDRPRPKTERIEWFLASIYCTCGVGNDTCTGHYYTLASCNPNGCGMPNQARGILAGLIDKGLSDRQILDELLKKNGAAMLRPHLAP
jgi:hypothetical protein